MRFLPRSAEPIEPLDAGRGSKAEQQHLSLKAQHVLGTASSADNIHELGGSRSSRSRWKEPPETYIPSGSPPRRETPTTGRSPVLPPLNPTEPLSLDSEDSSSSLPKLNTPIPSGRMSPFPNLQSQAKYPPRTTSANDLRTQQLQQNNQAYAYNNARQPQRGPPSVTSSSAVQPHQFYPDSKPSIESFETRMRDFYDASTQPLIVSQQTSASAVRDHGLRKGSPMIAIHETSSDPTLGRSQQKPPLKSAMKKALPPHPPNGKRRDSERKGKKLDIGSIFAQQKPASAHGTPTSASTRPGDDFEFFPEETVRAKLQRPRPHARFETQKSIGGTSNNPDGTVREKVFEKDVFDTAKMNVRRPPKGIQNWFDGFDISSDEDERMYAKEKAQAAVATPPVELPANEALQAYGLPSVFSPYDGALQKHHPRQSQRPQRPAHNRKSSTDPVEDNLLAIEHAKQMMKKRAEAKQDRPKFDRVVSSSTLSASMRSQRGGESRLAHSRLGSQSVLSLSDSDQEKPSEPPSRRDSIGDESVILGNAASVGMHRPRAPPRQLQAASRPLEKGELRRSVSTQKTSGTIQMRLGSDVTLPPIPFDLSTIGSPPRAATGTAQALRRLNGLRDSSSQPARSIRTVRSDPDNAPSMTEQSIAEETTSSQTDGSRLMQVSEEEMILLELMRQKRAAMQKNSFSEGYRLALKQEQDHLAKRREGAHKTALQMLKAKEELNKRQSATSTVFSEDHENPAIAAMRRKYSALHREDVDKALKMERFLSLDPHGQVQVVPGADRFPVPDEEEEVDGKVAEEEPPVFLQPRTYSPMQKLTEKVRDASPRSHDPGPAATRSRSASTTPPEEMDSEYFEEHHNRVRRFLALSSASEAEEMFPTPPSHSRTGTVQEHQGWQKRGASFMSPSPLAEEGDEFRPPPDNRDSRFPEPLQPRRDNERQKKKTQLDDIKTRRDQYRLSYQPDSDPLLETIGGLAPPVNHKLHDPYPDITPNLDVGPLELPSAGFSGSPSLSSRPSPVTPTFPQVASQSDKTSVNGFIDIAGSGSENASLVNGPSGGRAYTPDTEFSGPVQMIASSRKTSATRRPPAPVATLDSAASKRADHRMSNAYTSAGEDVLAAWAELGGGSSDFNWRKAGSGRGMR